MGTKCCSCMLVALGSRNPSPSPCLRPAPPVLTTLEVRPTNAARVFIPPDATENHLAPLPCRPRKRVNAPSQSYTRLQSSPWQDSMSSAKMLMTYQLHGRGTAERKPAKPTTKSCCCFIPAMTPEHQQHCRYHRRTATAYRFPWEQ